MAGWAWVLGMAGALGLGRDTPAQGTLSLNHGCRHPLSPQRKSGGTGGLGGRGGRQPQEEIRQQASGSRDVHSSVLPGFMGRLGPCPTLPAHLGPSGLSPLPYSLHSCHQKCGRKSSLHFPGDVFAAAERAGGSPAQGPMPYLDDDIPLLNVEEEPGEFWRRPALLTLARLAPASAREVTFDEMV